MDIIYFIGSSYKFITFLKYLWEYKTGINQNDYNIVIYKILIFNLGKLIFNAKYEVYIFIWLIVILFRNYFYD